MNQITQGATSRGNGHWGIKQILKNAENIIDTEDMYFGVAQKGLN